MKPRGLKRFILNIKNLYLSRELIQNLIIHDFKAQFVSSYLGIIWAFLQPLINVLVYWFVFQVGFKTPPIANFPFILWLLCGLIPWFYFSEALNSAAYSFLEYSYLVSKIVFRISILPVVKILSSLIVHLFFVFVITIIFMIYGYLPDIYFLQVIYYLFATIIFLIGLSFAVSSLTVFVKDIGQFLGVILQLGFWLTPILWNYQVVPAKFQWLFLSNPMFYIIQGYRDSFIDKIWFWQRPGLTLYFWLITIIIMIIGIKIFRRLKPHFSDVL